MWGGSVWARYVFNHGVWAAKWEILPFPFVWRGESRWLGVRCEVWPLRVSHCLLLSLLLGDHSRNHQLKAWCHQRAEGSPHDTQLPRKIKFCCSNSTFCWNYLMSFKCKKVRWLSSTEPPLHILWITSSGAELSFLMGWRTI